VQRIEIVRDFLGKRAGLRCRNADTAVMCFVKFF
jgi:hypothetical protein